MSKAPCLNCEKRELGCHSNCEKYNEFKQEREKENATERERKEKAFVPYKKIRKRS